LQLVRQHQRPVAIAGSKGGERVAYPSFPKSPKPAIAIDIVVAVVVVVVVVVMVVVRSLL